MTHASTAAEVGHVLVILGSCWTAAWLVGDAVRGWTVVRRVGRRALRVVTWRPPRVRVEVDDVAVTLALRGDALARRRRTDRRVDCHRYGHLTTFDGMFESCRRCDAVPPPGSVLLDDPRPHPHP